MKKYLVLFLPLFAAACANTVEVEEDVEYKCGDQIIKTEKQRRTHYNYYTDREWDDLSTYDLCINVGLLGVDATVDLIIDCVNKMEK